MINLLKIKFIKFYNYIIFKKKMNESKIPNIIHRPDDNKSRALTYKIIQYSQIIDLNETNIIKCIIQSVYSSFDNKKGKKLSDEISNEIKNKLGGEWFVFVSNINKENIKFRITMFDEQDYLIISIENSIFKIAKLK